MLLVEQENLTFSELVPNFFCIKISAKKKCSIYCLNRNQIKIQMLLLFHSFPSCSTCTHPPLTVQKPKTLHTTEVYLGHVIFVLLKKTISCTRDDKSCTRDDKSCTRDNKSCTRDEISWAFISKTNSRVLNIPL